ncbi:hypothetical protein FGD67_21235 [Colwellia sp. M166]|uniref:hypothetical protein n=1 Tax=Colwellia sp. M166 TaxID=2583805 RepID=UPI00211E2569|nr:hypothetical protein [Colwellia sp. M166]UUO25456.1 hypothetical protein FGD67_21235 [Colwellia sp. M166]
MNQQLPPWTLVKTWLEIIQQEDITEHVKGKRHKMLTYYFGSIELAGMYVEQNQHHFKKAS